MAKKNATAKRHSRISISSPFSPSKPISQCIPYLMPFHIAHTGPAPVSTYFRVQDAKSHVGSPIPPDNTQETDSFPKETSDQKDLDITDSASTSAAVQPPEPSTSDSGAATSSAVPNSKNQSRFISSFRGRTIQGLKVEVPDGFTGVVFHSNDDKNDVKTKARPVPNAKGKSKGRETRSTRSRTVNAMDIDEVEEDEEDDEAESALDTQNLELHSLFKSFVVWHPDIPVDTGNDEYLASIGEWMKIATVLHQTPS
ncbi:hypothetical protein D9757_005896 [Collybiopsis confluens]|uniref:Uncharacterized protein n=1 Tax=Collybiopsis confluens TaxID=2823264 RepID=A0A8H5MA94_9AGAR|nr:hypothetical protein D9757_005896 [Collybiopsis confluens]